MIATLRRLGDLDGPDRRLLGEAVALSLIAGLGLELTRTETVARWLAAVPGGHTDVPLARIAWAVEAASRRVPLADRCLPRALVAQAMLNRRGHPAEVHLGVARPGGQFTAHAWTTADGAIVVGGEAAAAHVPLHVLGPP